MITRPLAVQELAAHPGFTHMAIVTADDLTQTTVATAQTLTLCNLAVGDVIRPNAVADYVIVPFQNTADAAFNTTTRSVGDSVGGVASLLAAGEANLNGTVVTERVSSATVGPITAATSLTVTFNAMAAKALASINKGELHVFWGITRVQQLSKGNIQALITTK